MNYPGIASALVLMLASFPAHSEAKLPPDVSTFVERRDMCDHFRGEEPYDAERKKFLAAKINQLCKGTDRNLAQLKRKYPANPEVQARLRDYEVKSE